MAESSQNQKRVGAKRETFESRTEIRDLVVKRKRIRRRRQGKKDSYEKRTERWNMRDKAQRVLFASRRSTTTKVATNI